MKETMNQAAAVVAKCRQSKLPYGIRIEKKRDGAWHATWAFKLSQYDEENKEYRSTMIPGRVELDVEYPGCPYCGAKAWTICGSCGKLTCGSGKAPVSCSWCNMSAERKSQTQTQNANNRGTNAAPTPPVFNDPSLSDFKIVDGVLVKYLGSKSEVTIPNKVTSIASNAFYGKGIQRVTIPESVTSIGDWRLMDVRPLAKMRFTTANPFRVLPSPKLCDYSVDII